MSSVIMIFSSPLQSNIEAITINGASNAWSFTTVRL
jgi:hypothetical protein